MLSWHRCAGTPGLALQELKRILADKELKEALLGGIDAFNQNAVKGRRSSLGGGAGAVKVGKLRRVVARARLSLSAHVSRVPGSGK